MIIFFFFVLWQGLIHSRSCSMVLWLSSIGELVDLPQVSGLPSQEPSSQMICHVVLSLRIPETQWKVTWVPCGNLYRGKTENKDTVLHGVCLDDRAKHISTASAFQIQLTSVDGLWSGPLFAIVEELSVFEEHGALGSRRRRAGLTVAPGDVHVAVFGDVAAAFEFLPRDAAEIDH